MRVDSAAAQRPTAQRPQWAMRGVTGSAPSSPSTATLPASAGSDSAAAGRADFTNMTRKDLFDWMNTQIKNGAMSLDESSGLLNMTMKLAVGGSPGQLDDKERVNFMQLARDGVEWAKSNNDKAQQQTLQTAIAVMQQHQGEAMRVNLTA